MLHQERLQRQAGGSPQTPVESKGVQERTETAMEATGANETWPQYIQITINLGEDLLCIDFLGHLGIQSLETSPSCRSPCETKISRLWIGFLPKIGQKVRKQYDLKYE